jgi:perosamine synthetase
MSRTVPLARPLFDDREHQYLREVMDSGFVGQGPMTRRFERAFAEFVGVRFAIGTNSGTTALQVALMGVGIEPGDEVIVPALSYVASANAVIHAGGKPVFVDVEPDTFNLDPGKIEDVLTERTRAITATHLLGVPAELEAIKKLCEKYDLALVEDCALAHGGEYHGKQVGTFSDAAIYSFYGSKIITTGEGGMIVTDSEPAAEKMRLLRAHGNNPDKRFDHVLLGYSYQLSDLASAVGMGQLLKLPEIVSRRRRNAELLNQGLAGVPGIQTPTERPETRNACFAYSILLTDDRHDRDAVMRGLTSRGIETRPIYYVIPHLPFYGRQYGVSFPQAQRIAERGLFLSCAPGLTEDDIGYVCEALRSTLRA